MAHFDELYGRTLGEFVLRERLDEGGFGAVYRCDQPLLGREAVVKVLHQRLRRHDAAIQRFLREAQLASRLNHPYAAHVYAFGVEEEDGLVWIAMELVQGITLHHWLETRGPLTLEQLVPLFDCIAEVVQAAHERGIVHRDLKPSNIMIIERAGRLLPKLLDFGVAMLLDDVVLPKLPMPDAEFATRDTVPPAAPGTGDVSTRLLRKRAQAGRPMRRTTDSGANIGSPPYMAPEQWAGTVAVGPASDLYALAVVAYEALTGRRPFIAETVDEYDALHCNAPVPPLGGSFSRALDRTFERALAKRPEDRFANVLELAAALSADLRSHLREQLRVSAQQWDDRARQPELLWRGRALGELERWTRHVPAALTEPETSFIAASRKHSRRAVWTRRMLGLAVAAAITGVFLYRSALRAELAEVRAADAEVRAADAEARITDVKVEAGRQALLHGESDEALTDLGDAYRRGDRSPSLEFMLARALQPRRAELARFSAATGRMWSATFSPDGRRIVTTDDRSAQVWDAQTNHLLFTLSRDREVYDAVFSGDGKKLVTVAADAIRVWNAADGAPLRELHQSHGATKPSDYYRIALSPDGTLVAAIDAMGDVADVWNMNTAALVTELRGDGSEFPTIAFSADGRWLAICGGSDVRVFDTASWAHAAMLAEPHIRRISFDPTGPRILTGSATGSVSIWSIPHGARLHHLRDIGEPVDAVAFSPDGALVVAASHDGAELVWDAATGSLRSQGNYLHNRLMSVEFDAASKLIVAAGANGAAVVSDAALGMSIALLDGPRNMLRTARFDPSSHRVIGASWDGTARVWDTTSPYRRWGAAPLADGCGLIGAGALDPDARFVAVGCPGHATRVWDTANDRLLAELPSIPPADGVDPMYPAVSATGDQAAIARGNTVEVYALPGGKVVRTIAHSAPVTTVSFAAQGHDLLSGDAAGTLFLTREGRTQQVLAIASGGIDAADFLADGRIVAVDARSRMRLYAATGAVVAELATPSRVHSLRPSPDGHRLLGIPSYAGQAAPPVLWDLTNPRLITMLEGQSGQVLSARFVASGSEIITAGTEGAARRWSSSDGRLLGTYRGGTHILADATLSPDGLLLVGGGGGGIVQFWDVATSRLLWTIRAHKSDVVGVHFEHEAIVTRGFSGDLARWTLPSAHSVIDATLEK